MNRVGALALRSGESPVAGAAPQIVNPLEDPAWDERVAAHPDCSVFHSAGWARVLHHTYGHRPAYFVCGEEGRIQALLPMMEVSSPFTGKRAVSLPFSDECRPLGFQPSEAPAVLHALVKCGRERRWRYWECRGGRDLFGEVPASDSYLIHTLDLRPGLGAVLAGVKHSARHAIHQAERHGLKGRIDTGLEALRAYYGMHCQTRAKHGIPPQPWSFFLNIHRHILSQEHGVVSLVTHQGKAVAGAVFLTLGRKALYKFSASDPSALRLRGNNLQMWTAIEWLCDHGFEELSLGRTDVVHAGLRSFKQAWGAAERRVSYFKYDLGTGQFVRAVPSRFGCAGALLRRMPSSWFRLAGVLLYRHLSSWMIASEAIEALQVV